MEKLQPLTKQFKSPMIIQEPDKLDLNNHKSSA